jgi:D-alanine-D-alanine ligase
MSIKENSKIKVAVLYGGRSAEHEVSSQSAAAVIKHLDRNKFTIIPIGIDKQGYCFVNDVSQFSGQELVSALPLQTKTSTTLTSIAELNYGKKPICDVVFPLLHGSFGEDGTIQGLLEILDLAYVGADVLGSALSMDKDMAKRLVSGESIPVVPFLTLNSGLWSTKQAQSRAEIERKISYPLFVKPANSGSSLGVTKVKKSTDLSAAIELAFTYSTKVLLEKAFEVREIEIAVLENSHWGEEPLLSTAGEIIPRHEFYSYKAKYLDAKGAELIIPAVLQAGQLTQLKSYAAQIFTRLNCAGMARIDFFIEKQSQKIYFNELNTIPGFTKISMYPKLWEASGITYQQVLTHLIELALARQHRLALLKRSL